MPVKKRTKCGFLKNTYRTLLCKKILTWKTDLHRSCRIPQPWTFDLAFTMWEDALELWPREGYSKVEGSAEENPGLSK
jgi:hypothetical protein